jgi:hypothetical protein
VWDSLGVIGLRAGSALVHGRARLHRQVFVLRPEVDATPDEPGDAAYAPLRLPAGRERPQLLVSVLRLVAIVVLAALVLSAVAFATGLALARALERLGA